MVQGRTRVHNYMAGLGDGGVHSGSTNSRNKKDNDQSGNLFLSESFQLSNNRGSKVTFDGSSTTGSNIGSEERSYLRRNPTPWIKDKSHLIRGRTNVTMSTALTSSVVGQSNNNKWMYSPVVSQQLGLHGAMLNSQNLLHQYQSQPYHHPTPQAADVWHFSAFFVIVATIILIIAVFLNFMNEQFSAPTSISSVAGGTISLTSSADQHLGIGKKNGGLTGNIIVVGGDNGASAGGGLINGTLHHNHHLLQPKKKKYKDSNGGRNSNNIVVRKPKTDEWNEDFDDQYENNDNYENSLLSESIRAGIDDGRFVEDPLNLSGYSYPYHQQPGTSLLPLIHQPQQQQQHRQRKTSATSITAIASATTIPLIGATSIVTSTATTTGSSDSGSSGIREGGGAGTIAVTEGSHSTSASTSTNYLNTNIVTTTGSSSTPKGGLVNRGLYYLNQSGNAVIAGSAVTSSQRRHNGNTPPTLDSNHSLTFGLLPEQLLTPSCERTIQQPSTISCSPTDSSHRQQLFTSDNSHHQLQQPTIIQRNRSHEVVAQGIHQVQPTFSFNGKPQPHRSTLNARPLSTTASSFASLTESEFGKLASASCDSLSSNISEHSSSSLDEDGNNDKTYDINEYDDRYDSETYDEELCTTPNYTDSNDFRAPLLVTTSVPIVARSMSSSHNVRYRRRDDASVRNHNATRTKDNYAEIGSTMSFSRLLSSGSDDTKYLLGSDVVEQNTDKIVGQNSTKSNNNTNLNTNASSSRSGVTKSSNIHMNGGSGSTSVALLAPPADPFTPSNNRRTQLQKLPSINQNLPVRMPSDLLLEKTPRVTNGRLILGNGGYSSTEQDDGNTISKQLQRQTKNIGSVLPVVELPKLAHSNVSPSLRQTSLLSTIRRQDEQKNNQGQSSTSKSKGTVEVNDNTNRSNFLDTFFSDDEICLDFASPAKHTKVSTLSDNCDIIKSNWQDNNLPNQQSPSSSCSSTSCKTDSDTPFPFVPSLYVGSVTSAKKPPPSMNIEELHLYHTYQLMETGNVSHWEARVAEESRILQNQHNIFDDNAAVVDAYSGERDDGTDCSSFGTRFSTSDYYDSKNSTFTNPNFTLINNEQQQNQYRQIVTTGYANNNNNIAEQVMAAATDVISSNEGSIPSNDPRKSIAHIRTDLTSDTDAAASLQGAVNFTDLKLVEVIGGGGFGQVWRAVWRGTPVAVKVLTGSAQSKFVPRAVLQEFAAEINLLRGMRHPNICLYMGACIAPPNRAIITELAANGSLWDALRLPLQPPYTACDGSTRNGWPDTLYQPDSKYGSPPILVRATSRHSALLPSSLLPSHQNTVPPRGTWHWVLVKHVARGAARGMAYLHSGKPPVLHRDLKSANILLDESYTAKVCDFGLSRLKAVESSMTGNCGTVQWMAPEVLSNEHYNEKADVYSYGIICWELLTAECPYDGMTPIQCALAVLNRDYRPEIPRWCPPSLQALIRTCVKKDPSARPTFEQIIAALDSMP